MRIRCTTLLVSLFCLAASGCTTPSQGEPTSAPTTGRTTGPPQASGDEDDLPGNGVPQVEHPLDTSRFQEDPCTSLTAQQALELNVPASGEKQKILYGVGCEWRNPETRGRIQIGFLGEIHRGLTGVYDANGRGEYPYFDELPDIEGYPAIAGDIEDRRPRGICVVSVGVTDQLLMDVYLTLPEANIGRKDPCGVAADVAGMALQTMKKGT
jgi:hypothetical protein